MWKKQFFAIFLKFFLNNEKHFLQVFSRFAGIGWPCLRFNKTGWEIVVGPILCGTKRSKGFFDESDNWVRLDEWKKSNPGQPDPDNTTKMLDTKGEFGLTTSFVLAFGKNFRSGKLNFPVNIFAIPHAEGFRYGISVGFNR